LQNSVATVLKSTGGVSIAVVVELVGVDGGDFLQICVGVGVVVPNKRWRVARRPGDGTYRTFGLCCGLCGGITVVCGKKIW